MSEVVQGKTEQFEAVVQAIKSHSRLDLGDEALKEFHDYGETGLYLYRRCTTLGEGSRHSRLDLGDEALKEFHIGQKVRVTVEAVE